METTNMGYIGIIGHVLGFCNGSHYITMGSTLGCIEVCKFIVPITENTSHMANGNKWKIITHEMQTTTCEGCERLLQYHTYIYIYIHMGVVQYSFISNRGLAPCLRGACASLRARSLAQNGFRADSSR